MEVQEELEEQQEPRRSTRVRKAPDFYMGLHELLLMDTDDPLTYEEAIRRKDSKAWQEVM